MWFQRGVADGGQHFGQQDHVRCAPQGISQYVAFEDQALEDDADQEENQNRNANEKQAIDQQQRIARARNVYRCRPT